MRTVPRNKRAVAKTAGLPAVILAGVAVLVAGLAGCSGSPASTASTHSPPTTPASSSSATASSTPGSQAISATLCNNQRLSVDSSAYMVQNNEYDSAASQCVGIGGTGGFTVSKSAIANAPNGTPGGYPSIYRGCHWGLCTQGSGLPVQASKLLTPGTVTTTWATTQPGTGTYDVAYDIWFNKAPTTDGQPDGAELMIWLNHNGPVEPYGSQVSTATVSGRSYQVWYGNEGWNTITYSMTTGTTSVKNLDIGKFVADAIRRGYIQKSWYLIDVEAGFELWQGGAGLATNDFAVNAPGSSSAAAATAATTAFTAPSSAPVTGGGSCAVSYSLVNTWPDGLQAQAVLTNTSGRPLNGWKLTWSFAGDQRITDLWNGAYTQSGNRVSVTNGSYDGTIAPSASVTVGFTGTSTGNDPPPAAFQLNGANCAT
jgi:Glycosyl hydrolase family 12/Cellulose binding domain